MRIFPFLKPTSIALIPSLLLTSACTWTTKRVAITDANPEETVVVADIDGALYGLLKWNVDSEENIMGSGSVFSPGSATVDELLSNTPPVLGDPFNGTIPSSRITDIFVREATSQGTDTAVTTALVLVAVAGIAALTLFIVFVSTYEH